MTSSPSPKSSTASTSEPPRPNLFALAKTFLRLGAQAFGGQAVLLSLLSRDLVQQRAWIHESDITDALTYTNLLPGSTNVQVVAFLGWKLRGLRGTVTATVAFLLPSFVVMLCFAVGYHHLALLTGFPAALRGLTASAVGVMVTVAWTLGHKTITSTAGILIAAAVFIASVRYTVNSPLLVVGAGLLGVLREATRKRA